MKTLAQQIVELEALLATHKDALVQATKALETAEADDGEAFEAAVIEGTATVEKTVARLDSLRRAEKALGTQADPVAAPAVIKAVSKAKDTDDLMGKLALVEFESRVKGVSKEAVIQERFGDSEAVRTLFKAVQNPAMSGVAGYAQELTQQAYGQFMDLLREQSLMARVVPLTQQHQFGPGVSSIYIPKRIGGDVQAAGTFRAEGSPIPVKGLTFTSQVLTPKNLGVILTATAEMLRRSAMDLSSYFQRAMVADTGSSLDALFLSATAGSVIQPAGIQNGVGGGDTRPASGSGTNADIVADLKAMLTAMTEAHMGNNANTRWVMSPKNWYTVSMALTATGALQFPETANGTLVRIPVIVTQNVADDIVLLVDFTEISTAVGAPNFLASEVATLHEDTAPSPISTVGTPNAVAAPIRSLYQTNSWALRLMMDCDWAKMRTAGLVQQLTAVAWIG